MGVKTKVPKATALVGKRRVDGGVIQKQHALIRFTCVVLVEGLDQGRCHSRTVTLQNKPSTIIDRASQSAQSFFGLAFAVIAGDRKFARTLRQTHATTLVDALNGPLHVSENGFTGITERST